MSWIPSNQALAALAALALTAPVLADQSPEALADEPDARPGKCRHHPEFSEFDLDDNGEITQEEFNLAHAERFKKRAAEGRKLKNAKPLPAMFAKIDVDDDKILSPEEFEAHKAQGCGKKK